MPKGTLQIRRQIRSIGNTKKVTKAMELVSAAKMRKAVFSALSTRPYAQSARALMIHLSGRAGADETHPLLAVRPVRTVGIIVVSSNRGLCGGFNTNIATLVRQTITQETAAGASSVELITVGRRARDLLVRTHPTLAADFVKKDVTKSVADIIPLVHMVMERYAKKTFDKVILVYTDYISSVRQKAIACQILPVIPLQREEERGDETSENEAQEFVRSMFEPSAEAVLEYVLPRLLEVQVFQAVLESEASEHSARMLAMHNASQSATDMLSDLRLTYNQIRQSGITQEIAEISSGRAALE